MVDSCLTYVHSMPTHHILTYEQYSNQFLADKNSLN